jgi:NhaP-type Na+/H+ or K+/H+ antiporter
VPCFWLAVNEVPRVITGVVSLAAETLPAVKPRPRKRAQAVMIFLIFVFILISLLVFCFHAPPIIILEFVLGVSPLAKI